MGLPVVPSSPPRLDEVSLTEHPFYAKTPAQQRAFRLGVLGGLVASLVALGGLMAWTGSLWPAILLPVPFQIAAPFFDVPSGRAKGTLVYQAPLFIVERTREGSLELHGGTLLDYWFVLRSSMSAAQRRRRVMLDFLRGLIRLARTHVRDGGPSFTLRATTYFLSPRTARRAGFTPAPPDGRQLLLWLNAIPIALSVSLLERRPSLPPLHRARSYQASIESLVEHLPALEALERRLDARASRSG